MGFLAATTGFRSLLFWEESFDTAVTKNYYSSFTVSNVAVLYNSMAANTLISFLWHIIIRAFLFEVVLGAWILSASTVEPATTLDFLQSYIVFLQPLLHSLTYCAFHSLTVGWEVTGASNFTYRSTPAMWQSSGHEYRLFPLLQ